MRIVGGIAACNRLRKQLVYTNYKGGDSGRIVEQLGELGPSDTKSGEDPCYDLHRRISLPALHIAEVVGGDAGALGCFLNRVAAVGSEASKGSAERRVGIV